MAMLEYNPPMEPLDIVYQDEAILAVNKPAGLLSNPAGLFTARIASS